MQIDSDIPAPVCRNKRREKIEPLSGNLTQRLDRSRLGPTRSAIMDLEVGQSFRVCDIEDYPAAARCRTSAHYVQRVTGRTFTIRQYQDHMRIWRMA